VLADLLKKARAKKESAAAASSSSGAPPPQKNGEEKPLFPEGHKCTKAAKGELACVVCSENRVDATLSPCGHTNLCVECATRAYLETKDHPCPTCRRAIKRVKAAFVSGTVEDGE